MLAGSGTAAAAISAPRAANAGAPPASTSVINSVRWTTVTINVRGHPTTSSKPLFVLPSATAVRVVRVATDVAHRTWYLVRVHSRLGWLAAWLTRGPTAPAKASATTTWTSARATSFGVGDGLVGARMACGDTLTTTVLAVAHRTLPCGTRLQIKVDSHVVEARVMDRGPFVDGLSFDLAPAVCHALGACYGITTVVWRRLP